MSHPAYRFTHPNDFKKGVNHVADVTIRAPLLVLPAYYFPQWPKANATLSDMLGKGIIGAKSDFPKVLDELAAEFEKIPQA